MPRSPLTERIVELIKAIPKGKVCSYGKIAELAGNPLGARQVVRVLSTLSRPEKLPWHRVINSQGKISPQKSGNDLRQRDLLIEEGIEFDHNNKIDLSQYLWEENS